MTSTSDFGSGERVSHDASAYYARHLQPLWFRESVWADGAENPLPFDDEAALFCQSSEAMTQLPDRSVHLMVTSPPYNVGKQYDADLAMPDYIAFIKSVLSETYRVLAPGGRACVNVSDLGRKPYLPLHAYIIQSAEEIGYTMRGTIIWEKGNSGLGCAWGSWLSASDPVLRDTREFVLVFQREGARLRGESTMTAQEFTEWTKSTWHIQAESAKRIGHPAPFPVELPRRLINLYSFKGDVVLDPFCGSGTTGVAALRSGRRFVGYDTDPTYIELARQRMAQRSLL